MKKLSLFIASFAMVLSFATVGLASGDHSGDHGHETTGEVVKIDGPFVTVKGKDGKSHKFHVNKSTHKKGKVTLGAKVKVEATDAGHALEMTVIK